MLVRTTLIAGLACLAGCSSVLGIGDLDGPSDAATPPDDNRVPLSACRAQRVVHIVAGTGGLAWFTLVWPAPSVIQGFVPTFAYDNPANAIEITTNQAHPLFVRRFGAAALWAGRGTAPQPTVIVAGLNETHTNTPQSSITNAGVGLLPAAATLQAAALQPAIPALLLVNSAPYGTAPGAPLPATASDVEAAIAVLVNLGVVAQGGASVRPSAGQLANYVALNAAPAVTSLATRLAFAANVFKLGLVGSVMIPAFNDDPHGAFTDLSTLGTRVSALTQILDAFYADLATANELTCGDASGDPLAMSDNVVMVVTGDTTKNPFDNAGWADGTPGNSNVMYLRSNGFTKPGWFGELLPPPGGRTTFDPTTGLLSAGTTADSNTAAAWSGALFAIARGDRLAIAPFTSSPFNGLTVAP